MPRPDERTWVLPDEPVPVRLVNTVWADRWEVHDDLHTTGDVAEWLVAVGAAPRGIEVEEDDLACARHLRDAIRRVASYVTGDDRDRIEIPPLTMEDAVAAINELTRSGAAIPQLRLSDSGIYSQDLTPTSPARTALASIAGRAVHLLGESPTQLRACRAPRCVLYFVQRPSHREWCSASCGNRARAARHYGRHRGEKKAGR